MKCNVKKARDERNFVRGNFFKMCSLLISPITSPFPSLRFIPFSLFFFFFAVLQLIRFNPLHLLFLFLLLTAGKPKILSAKESTNRQIIFPLKYWLFTLSSTWHPYFCEGKQQNLCMNIYLASMMLICPILSCHNTTTTQICCSLDWPLYTKL